MRIRVALLAALACLVVTSARAGDDDENPWTDGPDAPGPTTVPHPQAPREPGAQAQVLDEPAVPPEPARPALPALAPRAPEARFETLRTREDLRSTGALDLDTALVDVPGLWLFHEQAGASRMWARGSTRERDVAVTLDDVPVLDLRGLLPVLEQFTPSSHSSWRLHHGPRVDTGSRGGAAGLLELSSLDEDALRDQGETMRLQGMLGGGYGGADLEKGVFTIVETGFRRARIGLHATLLNREDQRLGRGLSLAGDEPGGLLLRSGGSGGAVGARVDVVPMRDLHVFSTWHSSRALEVAHPDLCRGSDRFGRAVDCTRTTERGLDVWIVGGDERVALAGATLLLHGRAHTQHAVANEQRTGAFITVADTFLDDGVRAGARGGVELVLPSVALVDVWRPRAEVGVDLFRDTVTSRFFTRSTRLRDAEVPGLGVEDPSRARLATSSPDDTFAAISLALRADGARASLWADGRIAGDGPAAEIGGRARLLEDVSAFLALVHRPDDDTLEGGVLWSGSFFDVDAVLWGSTRPAVERGVDVRDAETGWGTEARASLRPGLDGLVARGTLGVVSMDRGALLDVREPLAGVPNPAATLLVAYAPSTMPAGFFARARGLLPQQRLSRAEVLDVTLCPERPTGEELAAGVQQQQACSGAPGAFLLDVGAHVTLGRMRFDAVAENLLDQQGALRDEPIGFGGTSVRGLLTLAL